jgi:hypothetical protein
LRRSWHSRYFAKSCGMQSISEPLLPMVICTICQSLSPDYFRNNSSSSYGSFALPPNLSLPPTTKHLSSRTRLTITVRNVHRRVLISSASNSTLRGFQWLKRRSRSFLHVRSGFMSKSGGSLSALPPCLDRTQGGGRGGQEEPLLRRPQQTNKYDGYLPGRDAYNHCVTSGLIVASAAVGAKILASG